MEFETQFLESLANQNNELNMNNVEHRTYIHMVGTTSYSMQLVQDPGHGPSVAAEIKKGNTVHRAGLEPTSLTFGGSVLTITPRGLLDATITPMHPCLCGYLPQRSVQTTTAFFKIIIYFVNTKE